MDCIVVCRANAGDYVWCIAGFLEYVDEKMRAFVKETAPSDECVNEMSEVRWVACIRAASCLLSYGFN